MMNSKSNYFFNELVIITCISCRSSSNNMAPRQPIRLSVNRGDAISFKHSNYTIQSTEILQMKSISLSILVRNVLGSQVVTRRAVQRHFDIAMYCLHHETNPVCKHILSARQPVLRRLFLLNEFVELNREVELDSTKINYEEQIDIREVHHQLPVKISREISQFRLIQIEIIKYNSKIRRKIYDMSHSMTNTVSWFAILLLAELNLINHRGRFLILLSFFDK